MNNLYLILNIGSILIPFIFSFHPKILFYKKWTPFIISTSIMMIFFIIWDILFVINGIWGFNEQYLLGLNLLNLPIEEWLFFICIPYACVFTHESLIKFFPNLALTKKATSVVFVLLLVILIIGVINYYARWYTLINFLYLLLLMIIVFLKKRRVLSKIFITFLFILIPFFLVNGILTGSFIEQPIVWYNDMENMGVRIGSIPVEDLFYAFSMLLTVIFLMELQQKESSK